MIVWFFVRNMFFKLKYDNYVGDFQLWNGVYYVCKLY